MDKNIMIEDEININSGFNNEVRKLNAGEIKLNLKQKRNGETVDINLGRIMIIQDNDINQNKGEE